jgi:hypothetical protein
VKSLHKNGWMDIRWTINNHKSSDTWAKNRWQQSKAELSFDCI